MKSKFLVLAVLVIVTVAAGFFAWKFSQVQPWLNMIEEKAWNQSLRAINENALACEKQGGQWFAGFADMGCTISYVAPNVSGWWIRPEENPEYFPAQNWMFRLAVLSGTAGVFALAWGLAMIFSPGHNPSSF